MNSGNISRTNKSHEASDRQARRRVELESPKARGRLAALLRHRRSVKSYSSDELSIETLGQLLNTAFGVGPGHQRPYGSAYARYDITVTAIAVEVTGLAPAAYHYLAEDHALTAGQEGDHRPLLAQATLDAAWITECPVTLLLSADLDAANEAFEAQGTDRGERFCWFEAGLLAQNVYLWAAENALGTVFLGGLDFREMQRAAEGLVPASHTVLGLLPIGYPAE